MATHHVDDAHHRGGGGRSGGAVREQHMRGLSGDDNYGQQQQSAAAAVAKALAAGTAAFSLLLLSGLALTGTVLALIVATPLLVIFSPVLAPACFTVALLTVGFVSSGGLGAAAVGVLAWMYRYLQQQQPHRSHGEQQSKAHDVKDWAQHRLDQSRTAH